MAYTVTTYDEGLFLLDDGRVRQFLFTGGGSALLVDTGFEDSHVIDTVRELTDLPVRVVLTHGDGDHTGGLGDFGKCWVHEKDAGMIKPGIEVHTAAEGDVFPVGSYKLEVVHIPGHTYGSIALLDRTKKLLFPGDSIAQEGPIFMFGENRNLDLYLASLRKLQTMKTDIATVFPCHGGCPVGPEYIDYCLEDALAYQAGELEGEAHPFMPCKVYKGRHISFLF